MNLIFKTRNHDPKDFVKELSELINTLIKKKESNLKKEEILDIYSFLSQISFGLLQNEKCKDENLEENLRSQKTSLLDFILICNFFKTEAFNIQPSKEYLTKSFEELNTQDITKFLTEEELQEKQKIKKVNAVFTENYSRIIPNPSELYYRLKNQNLLDLKEDHSNIAVTMLNTISQNDNYRKYLYRALLAWSFTNLNTLEKKQLIVRLRLETSLQEANTYFLNHLSTCNLKGNKSLFLSYPHTREKLLNAI